MKEKIKGLAKGKFEYEIPSIILSEERIKREAETGKVLKGTILISNNQGKEMKGVLYSSNQSLKLEPQSFIGVETSIEFEFSAVGSTPGELVQGDIYIVSNCGEIAVPFTFAIEAPYCMTSMGKMRDLFHFANLAKLEPVEAIQLFKSNEFQRVFLYHDERNTMLYKNLIKSTSSYHAQEEFLIGIHKKVRINISMDKTEFLYENVDDPFKDKVLITKDNWGYVELLVDTDASFISLEHNSIGPDNFIGNTCELEFVINPQLMSCGNNYGRIYLKSIYQTLVVEITGKKKKETNSPSLKNRESRLKFVQNYLNFRTNHIANEFYIAEMEGILQHAMVAGQDNQVFFQLMRIHLCLIAEREVYGKETLDKLIEKQDRIKEEDVIDYCGLLYLRALYSKSAVDVQSAAEEIRSIYVGEKRDWRILWYLLYLDKQYEDNPHQKRKDIFEHIKKGCHSPIWYYEAFLLYKEDPSLLQEMNPYTIQITNWVLKMGIMSGELKQQYIYLVGREKKFHPLLFNGLVKLYKEEPSDDILVAICSMLIKGQKVNKKYFEWYRLGVEAQIKLTELYENYMYTLDESLGEPLPQAIMVYFLYDSTLSNRKKAYLYANIIRNKEKNIAVYRTYSMIIEKFAMKQLAQHQINSDLAIIYEEVLSGDKVEEQIARDLPYVMFQHEITCYNPNVVGVCVAHKELENEVFVPFTNGKARINIFTDNAEVFLVDMNHNRHIATLEYTINKLMYVDDYANQCYQWNPDNSMVMLNLFARIENYQKYDENSIGIRRKFLELDTINASYRKNSILVLIDYYYDNFEGVLLDELLLNVDLHRLDKREQSKIIEKMIIRDLYDKAFEEIHEFGYDGISIKRLIKLISKIMLDTNFEEKTEELVDLANYIFTSGKYNETVLQYLVLHFIGSTSEMVSLWKAAIGFKMDTINLEERLLAQILFAESYVSNATEIFMSFYQKGGNKLVSRAFLSYSGYRYLVGDRPIKQDIIEIMKKELRFEENEVCMLTLLKYYGSKDVLTEEERNFAELNLYQFYQKGMVLPFFQGLNKFFTIPSNISNKYFVEYICNPAHTVKIHYRIVGEKGETQNSESSSMNQEDFTMEIMKNVYQGIHVKDFILFYDETLQYYISEESEEGEIITESYNLRIERKMEEQYDNRYNAINFMLLSKEMQDEHTLIESMKNYVKKNYANEKAFKPL